MRLSSIVVAALLGSPLACTMTGDTCGQSGFRCSQIADESSSADGSSGGDACEADAPGVTLQLENRTGNTIEVVQFVRCDGTDPSEFPLMPPGLADGEDVELPFPGPGCWLLSYSGDDCEPDAPQSTEMLCAGESFVWTPDAEHHICVG